MAIHKFSRTPEETLLVYLQHHLQLNTLIYPFIKDMDKFIKIENGVVTVDLNQLKTDYIINDVNSWCSKFIKFSHRALSFANKNEWLFVFNYKDLTIEKRIDCMQYKKEFAELIKQNCNQFDVKLNANGEIDITVEKDESNHQMSYYVWFFQPLLAKLKHYKFFTWVNIYVKDKSYIIYKISYN